jgi:hypothetical protein
MNNWLDAMQPIVESILRLSRFIITLIGSAVVILIEAYLIWNAPPFRHLREEDKQQPPVLPIVQSLTRNGTTL